MKKILITFLISSILSAYAFTIGQAFPEIKGHTLEKNELTIPKDVKGKFTLVALASSMRAQEDLDTWLQPMYSSFAENPMYAVNLFIIPLTKGFILVGPDKVESQIKASLDKEYYKYILVYNGEVGPIRKALGMEEKDKPYLYVIDPRGNITYKTSGKYTEEKMEEIADKLSE